MQEKLIQAIIDGAPEERDDAARQICQSRKLDLMDELVENLHHSDPNVRETIIKIVSVLGDEKLKSGLDEISKNDPETNVRIAAIISKQNMGRLTYERLSAEIKRFHHEGESEDEKDEAAQGRVDSPHEISDYRMPEIKRVTDKESDIDEKTKKRTEGVLPVAWVFFSSRKILVIAAGVLLVIILGILFRSSEKYGASDTESSAGGSKAVAMMIKERIAAINKFKSLYLDPESATSRYPMTLEIRTVTGDTYDNLFEMVYGNSIGTEIGMNTIGAFWRHMNFGNDRKQNLVDVMERETSDELLLFPNPAAMNMVLNMENGSASFHSINKLDPDLEISIRVNSVTVR